MAKHIAYGFLLCVLVTLTQWNLCVGQELTVTLFEGTNFEGRSKEVTVTRCQNVMDFNDITTSIRTSGCVILYADQCCQNTALQVTSDISDLTSLSFRGLTTSLSPCDSWRAPIPDVIEETWLGHGQIMTKAAEDGDIGIYYNDAVNPTALDNHRETVKQIWDYVKATYGPNFGPEGGRLNAFIHADVEGPTYGFNSINNYFDTTSDCRNLIDLVSSSPDGWSQNLTGTEFDVLIHEIGHIVEGAQNGFHGSPGYGFWKDSKWAEIFIYDIYGALNLTSERERWYNQMQSANDNFPKPDTRWFVDWFYPVYQSHGGARVLKNFFNLLAEYYPKRQNGWQYDNENINLGQFVHFFSGAAGQDLRPQARIAFKFDEDDERLWEEARVDFPDIEY